RGLEAAKETVGLLVWTGGKEQHVGRLIVGDAAIAERDAPDAVDDDALVILAPQGAQEFPGRNIERVDVAVAKVADDQRIAEAAEIRRRDRHAPGRVQLAMLRYSPNEL